MKIPDPPVGAKRCWFCGDVPQKPGVNRCDACDRQKVRVGVTPCCGVLPLSPGPGEKRYCPACPGEPEDNRVPVVLISPSGEEKTSYHPRTVARALARTRKCAIDAVVIRVRTERDWMLYRPVARKVEQPRIWINFTCIMCRERKSYVTTPGGKRRTICDPCLPTRKRMLDSAAQKRRRERLRAEGPQRCPLCDQSSVFFASPDHCDMCDRQMRRNGRCDRCERPRARTKRGKVAQSVFYCPTCDPRPLPPPTGQARAIITITDGERFETRTVARHVILGGRGCASAWLAPVLLVDRIPPARSRLNVAHAPVISGLHIKHLGPAGRVGLGVMVAGQDLRAAVPMSDYKATLAHLVKAGLATSDGRPTERGRAVAAWARAAGVKL